MPDEPYPGDLEGAAERRLAEHLGLVRANSPESDRALGPRIVRRAGWQRLVRAPLEVVGTLIAAVADAISVFSRTTERKPE